MADGPLARRRRLRNCRTTRRAVVGAALFVLYVLFIDESRDLSRRYLSPPWQLVVTPLAIGAFALLATAVWRALLRREVLDFSEPTQQVELMSGGGIGRR